MLITVTAHTDIDGAPDQLRETIDDVCDGGTIEIEPGTIVLERLNLIVPSGKTLTIVGLPADADEPMVTLVGNGATSRVLFVWPSANVTLESLVIANGYDPFNGGGIYVDDNGTLNVTNSAIEGNAAGYFGGGLWVDSGATAVITNSTIEGNAVGYFGGGLYVESGATAVITNSTIEGNTANSAGGGIRSLGSLTVTASTIEGNTADYGGGIFNYAGSVWLTNSTVSGNGADYGGGIHNFGDSPRGSPGGLTLVHSTVAFNTAGSAGAGIYNDDGELEMSASILDENWSPAVRSDCYSSVAPTSGGYNFIGDGTGCMWTDGVGDVVGQAGVAGLLPLQDNGGPTETHALVPLPAPYIVDTIPAAACAAVSDQRGVVRPQGAGCERGAFEFRPPVAVDDQYATPVNTPLVVSAPGVLGNDVAGDGGSPTVWITQGTVGPRPTGHGAATVERDGSVAYTPNAGFKGTDSFTYAITDGYSPTKGQANPPNTDTGTIRITVGNADPPVGLVDPSTGIWRLRNGGGVVSQFYYGDPRDYPFMGDWHCDGEDTPGLYRQSDGFAYLRNSSTQGNANLTFFFGNPGDVPLAGDFNGDGCDTVSIYRPSEARFYIMNKLGESEGGLGAAEYSFLFGNTGDKPVVGDWDGDGIDEIGLHRGTTGFFYYRTTLTTGVADGEFFFGDPGDRFVAGDWGVVDGIDTPALYRPSNTTFYFRHTLTQGNADSQFVWTGAGMDWLPVAGEAALD